MNRDEARKQVAEFSRLRKWDALTREAIIGLECTLAAVAPTTELGRRIVEQIIARQDEVPTEHEIRELARGIMPLTNPGPDGKPDCAQCGGTGWIIIEHNGLSAASWCFCRGAVSPSTPQALTTRQNERQGQWRPILGGGTA